MGAAGNLEGGLCSSRSLALGFSIATHCRAMQARDTPEHTGDEEQDSDKKKPGPTLHRRLLSNLVSSKHSTPLPPSEPLPALFLHPQPDDSRHNQVSPSLQCSPPTLDRSFQPCALPTPTSTYVFGMKSTCCAR